MNLLDQKIGILGGGQLGQMLQQKASEYGINLYIMDSSIDTSCGGFINFVLGDFKSYDDIVNFGSKLDVITIEIEHINVDALFYLESIGVKVIPNAEAIKTIQDKNLQKSFYKDSCIPSSDFKYYDREITDDDISSYPVVQKTTKEGYDGKGVKIIKDINDTKEQLSCPTIIESIVNIKKELAITYAKVGSQVLIYPIVEMVFDEDLNLLDYLLVPSDISQEIDNKIIQITNKIATNLNSDGIFSIEFFLNDEDEVLVNEMAPRAHNSCHYSIEYCNFSQFEIQLLILMGFKLPKKIEKRAKYGAIINLIGENGYQGSPIIEGINTLTEVEDANIHLYGKKVTKPGRKMGHITLLNNDLNKLKNEVSYIKSKIKIKSNE